MNSSSRGGARVIWLAVHTTEGIMRARDLRDWLSWPGSSHASCDETGELLTPDDGFVPYDRAAWTLRDGNPLSDNLEQCGWARWTRAEWLSRPLLLDATARWLAERSKARGIPLVKLTPAEVAARKPGVIGHADYTYGTGDGSHTDPGESFPWDVVLAKAVAYRDGAPTPPPEEDLLAAIKYAVVFAREADGTYWEHSVLNGTRVRLNSPQTLDDRKHWLKKCGVPFLDAGNVDRIDAFGVPIA